jgi:hypothetical protein
MKLSKLAVVAVVSGVLAACGGGGGGSSEAASGSAPVNAAAPATITKYNGSWTEGCLPAASIEINGSAAYAIYSLVAVEGLDAKNVQGTIQLEVFEDATCSTTRRALHSKKFSFTVDGTATASGKAVDRITVSAGAFGTLNAQTVTINGITYNDYFFTDDVVNAKDIVYVEGDNFFFGDALVKNDYPTMLETTPSLTRMR